MARFWISQRWRLPKLMIALLVIEFPFTVACLALFGIADGDTYRTTLWQNGFDKGFNSAPNSILYEYANYRTPHTPIVWSGYLTQYNIVISVLSMFLLLAKSTMYVLHVFIPLLSVAIHLLLIALYAVSIRDQSAPDMSDPLNPSPGLPWYLSKGCKFAEPGNYSYCMQARASFAVTCCMVALFSAYFLLAAWSSVPTEQEKVERNASRPSDIEMKKYKPNFNFKHNFKSRYEQDNQDLGMTKEEKWERNRQIFLNLPKTPNTAGFGMKNPMTPRTVAFTALNGGEGPSRPSAYPKALPMRQKYGS